MVILVSNKSIEYVMFEHHSVILIYALRKLQNICRYNVVNFVRTSQKITYFWASSLRKFVVYSFSKILNVGQYTCLTLVQIS